MIGRSGEGPGSAAIENVSLRAQVRLGPALRPALGPAPLRQGPAAGALRHRAGSRQEKDDVSARLTRVAARLASGAAGLIPEAAAAGRAGLRDPKDTLDLYNRYQLALEMEGRREFEPRHRGAPQHPLRGARRSSTRGAGSPRC